MTCSLRGSGPLPFLLAASHCSPRQSKRTPRHASGLLGAQRVRPWVCDGDWLNGGLEFCLLCLLHFSVPVGGGWAAARPEGLTCVRDCLARGWLGCSQCLRWASRSGGRFVSCVLARDVSTAKVAFDVSQSAVSSFALAPLNQQERRPPPSSCSQELVVGAASAADGCLPSSRFGLVFPVHCLQHTLFITTMENLKKLLPLGLAGVVGQFRLLNRV